MSLATIHTRARAGVYAPPVSVEVHLGNGLPAFNIVGLPEKAVQESRERVRGALVNSGFEFPSGRITVNLAPAELPKEGGSFDLPIAIGLLAASGQLPLAAAEGCEYSGELALSGAIRPSRGILPMTLACRNAERPLIVPAANRTEAALIDGARVFAAEHLLQVTGHLTGSEPLPPIPREETDAQTPDYPDLSEVRGQEHAKRALEIAAAGGHSLLMIGPPGSGKSMLAQRLPGILPPMSETEAIETAAVYSVSGAAPPHGWRSRPYRAPHHTASAVALVGGSSTPRPGEISLAHNGCLFLDELPEFDRRVLEAMREPLESGRVMISRASSQVEFPARFQLVAAMNPCPCGWQGDEHHACRCTAEQVARYQGRLSGPILNRIDLHIEVPSLPAGELLDERPPDSDTSEQVRRRVSRARQLQLRRSGCANNRLDNRQIEQHCAVDADGKRLLQQAMQSLGLSARAYHRVLKVARTIADLADSKHIALPHLAEAISYRRLDRGSNALRHTG